MCVWNKFRVACFDMPWCLPFLDWHSFYEGIKYLFFFSLIIVRYCIWKYSIKYINSNRFKIIFLTLNIYWWRQSWRTRFLWNELLENFFLYGRYLIAQNHSITFLLNDLNLPPRFEEKSFWFSRLSLTCHLFLEKRYN